jgi:hypothetical protein
MPTIAIRTVLNLIPPYISMTTGPNSTPQITPAAYRGESAEPGDSPRQCF